MRLIKLSLFSALLVSAACEADQVDRSLSSSARHEQAPHAPLPTDSSWNDAAIAWRSYEDGLREARAQNKPICLVMYATWCPHCTTYKQVFSDSRLVRAAKDFVMVRVDSDQNKGLSTRLSVDGEYVPRTFFLSPAGELVASARARENGRFQYFYDEHDPGSLLSGMQRARTMVR